MRKIYKNISFLIVLLLFGMMYSQASDCDSLKKAYKAKVDEWRDLSNEIKRSTLSEKSLSALLPHYNQLWEEAVIIEKKLIDCNGDSIGYEYREKEAPIIPYPEEKEEIFDSYDSYKHPILMKGSSIVINNHIKSHYPPMAKKKGISGIVKLQLTVNKEGIAEDAKIISEKPKNIGFGELAINSIKQVKFEPGTLNGKVIVARMIIPVKFHNP